MKKYLKSCIALLLAWLIFALWLVLWLFAHLFLAIYALAGICINLLVNGQKQAIKILGKLEDKVREWGLL